MIPGTSAHFLPKGVKQWNILAEQELTTLRNIAHYPAIAPGMSTSRVINHTIGWPEGGTRLCAEDPNHRVIQGEGPPSIQSFMFYTQEERITLRRRLLLLSHLRSREASIPSLPMGYSRTEPRHSSPRNVHHCSSHQYGSVHREVYPGWYSRRYTTVCSMPGTMVGSMPGTMMGVPLLHPW